MSKQETLTPPAPAPEAAEGADFPKVLPCPFDGGEPMMNHELRDGYKNYQDDPDAYAWYVTCRSCAAQGGWAKHEGGAARLWNMRAATRVDEGERKAMRERATRHTTNPAVYDMAWIFANDVLALLDVPAETQPETRYTCPACGFDGMDDPPQDCHICECCGCEHDFGRDISTCLTWAEWRAFWIADGMKWWSENDAPPDGWNAAKQLEKFDPIQADKRNAPAETATMDREAIALAAATTALSDAKVVAWANSFDDKGADVYKAIRAIDPADVAKRVLRAMTPEFTETIRAISPSPDRDLAMLTRGVEAGIEAAAKRACHSCKAGEPFSNSHENGWDWHIWEDEGETNNVMCESQHIRALDVAAIAAKALKGE